MPSGHAELTRQVKAVLVGGTPADSVAWTVSTLKAARGEYSVELVADVGVQAIEVWIFKGNLPRSRTFGEPEHGAGWVETALDFYARAIADPARSWLKCDPEKA